MKILTRIRNKIQKYVGPSIVIAGIGRCGTQLMYHSVANSMGFSLADKFLVDFSEEFNYARATVYKTHDFPPKVLPSHAKVIFMFGNPMNAAISGLNSFKGEKHYQHIHSPYSHEHELILSKDVLLMEEHFKHWYKPHGFEFLSVRYEDLYNKSTIKTISEYLDVEFILPEFRKRNTDWQSHPEKDSLWQTYGDLYEKISTASPVDLWAPRKS